MAALVDGTLKMNIKIGKHDQLVGTKLIGDDKDYHIAVQSTPSDMQTSSDIRDGGFLMLFLEATEMTVK